MTARRFVAAAVLATTLLLPTLSSHLVTAQTTPAQQLINGYLPAPNRRADEGRGPFPQLTIRGVMVIDGTGAPPYGPMDVTIANNRIQSVRGGGTPGVPARAGGAGRGGAGRGGTGAGATQDNVIDATGMYLMPGFVDMHVHGGGAPKNAELEYAYKLWLAHGVTTVRGVPMATHPVTVSERTRSEKNEIVAPRIINYQRPGQGWPNGIVDTPEKAREWVRWGAANGLDGLKLGAEEPSIMAALLDEAKKQNMGSTAHLQQTGVAQMKIGRASCRERV